MSILELVRDLPQVDASAGDVVVLQGDPRLRLYVLLRGEVVVERDGVAVARTSTPGAVFGEMAVALGRPATASVRCASDAVFAVADDPITFLHDNPGAALELLRVSAARVDALSQYLVDVKRQFADQDDHLGMLDTVLDALSHQQAPSSRPGSVRDPEG